MVEPTPTELKIRAIRDKTTDEEDYLDTPAILRFIDDNTVDTVYDLWGAVADSWHYMGRDELYMHKTEGDMTYTQPLCLYWETHYRSKAVGGGGVDVTVGEVKRTDHFKVPLP